MAGLSISALYILARALSAREQRCLVYMLRHHGRSHANI